jgi:hypothetical protein
LNIVDDLLFEIESAVAEQTNPRCTLFHDRFMTRSESTHKILENKARHSQFVSG